MITVSINGMKKTYPQGTYYEHIANDYQDQYENTIALVIENNKIRELNKVARDNAEISFITLYDNIGHKTYERTAIMLLIKAFADVAGCKVLGKVKVEFSIGQGCFCSSKDEVVIDEELVKKIYERMQQLVAQNIAIKKKAYSTDEAIRIFKDQGMTDKENLFRYRRSSYINVYNLDGYSDYYYGYMLPSTGYLKSFDIFAYKGGIMLMLPEQKTPKTLPKFEAREKLFETLSISNMWGEQLGIDTVGDLNNNICKGNLAELILVQEALQERRIGEIAKEIVRKGNVKFVMIAGPSSSGKTTFSHRLSVQLQTLGLKPHPIAVDDYFVEREATPKDDNGDYNFECLGAIDVEQFNKDMSDLLAGKTVEMPEFNFKTGHREYKGSYRTLGPDDILVIEGIHGLNDQMSYSLPNESKFKIYISALTSLNIDGHNRIPTTDGRLLRRMVRDARTRGTTAKKTIQMWPSVRKGEEENIFPYQESADAMFNSVLIYELAVLKSFAEPLLFSIEKEEPEYFEAKRLLKFLSYFLGVGIENLPKNSIVREFVGGSCFRV